MSIPAALVHIRISVPSSDFAATEALRDALRATVAAHADLYGVRIKRRIVGRDRWARLFRVYRDRAKLTTDASDLTDP